MVIAVYSHIGKVLSFCVPEVASIKGVNASFMEASGFMFDQEKTAKGNKISMIFSSQHYFSESNSTCGCHRVATIVALLGSDHFLI